MRLNKNLFKNISIVIIGMYAFLNYTNNEQTPLRILFIVGHFPSPSQIFILNSIIGLIDKGHKVSIFAFHKDDYKNIDPRIIEYDLLHKTTYSKSVKKLIYYDYDIIFCQFGYLAKRIVEEPLLEEWLKRRKLVVCFRGADISSRIKANPQMYKNLFKFVDLCLPVCSYFKKPLIASGCPSNKIIVHHSAINCNQFFFNPRKKPLDNEVIRLITVCRLVKKKGIDYAIKALARVIKKHKNIHFTIVGEGPERNYLKLLIHQLKLDKHVTLKGWATQEEVVSLLNQSHIFVLPSHKAPDGNEEGIPNALKEAMAMGLITIATWHAGNPELIDDTVSGFLVPEKDYSKLAQIIEYVIENPQNWERIGLAARKKVEKTFETKKAIEKLEKLFFELW